MGQKDKLIKKLKANPKNFTYEEAASLLGYFGYALNNKGKTSGSRIMFVKGSSTFTLHKPHPQKELKSYQVKILIQELEKEGLI